MEKTEYLNIMKEDFTSLSNNVFTQENKDIVLAFTKLYLPMIPKEILHFLSKEDLTEHLKNRYSFYSAIDNKSNFHYKINISDYSESELWMKNSLVMELIAKDLPFISDSLLYFFQDKNINIRNIINLSVNAKRENQILLDLKPRSAETNGYIKENFSLFFLDKSDINQPETLLKEMETILQEIYSVVHDFSEMIQTMKESSNEKNREFIHWLSNDNFIFMGLKSPEKRLGIYRSKDEKDFPKEDGFNDSFSGIQFYRTKTLSRIRKRKPLFLIEFENSIQVTGVFSRKSEGVSSEKIPVLLNRINEFFRSNIDIISSTSEKDFIFACNLFPLDYRLSEKIETLHTMIRDINYARITKNQSVKIISTDTNKAYAIILWPIEKYNDEIEKTIHNYFRKQNFSIHFHDVKVLSSVIFHFYAISTQGTKEDFTIRAEEELLGNLYDWNDRAFQVIEKTFEKEAIKDLVKNFLPYIPETYKNQNDPNGVIRDYRYIIKTLSEGFSIDILFDEIEKCTILNLYSKEEKSLSYLVPVLDNLGLTVISENSYLFNLSENEIYVYKFLIQYKSHGIYDEFTMKRLEKAISSILTGKTDSDLINSLIMKSPLCITQINLLKALINYMFQIKKKHTRLTMKKTLIDAPEIAEAIVNYFELRFYDKVEDTEKLKKFYSKEFYKDTDIKDLNAANESRRQFNQNLPFKNLTQAEIYKDFQTVIDAILRTNYFFDKEYLSFKISSSDIPFIEAPRPFREVWVYHTDMEAIHIRGGKIARGGLRWSDRLDDFRTEIWGLWKAQMLKNTVIIPTGSKGGFIIKHRANNRENAIWAYETFMTALLEITDNYDKNDILYTKNATYLDEKDPYLVVAADKGTATFSDYANAISIKKGFWLGDAYASGGKNGYSHKELGITANGAWESARWHFFLQNKNPFKDEFTVCAIGDLGGDVFGNGMIYTDKIRLIAAFNHKHIFLDPNPNAAKTFEERKRLFYSKAGGWENYNKNLISTGGGVFDRNAVSISLSKEAKEALEIDQDSASGEELIKIILKAPVDMLFNGGIGTYVKSSRETHHDVGDLSNDSVRIDASQLRAKMVIEGGNLGLTPQSRMEYALNGGLINTDALDNSGGVDLSDHEVNLKIFLKMLIHEGIIKEEERNQILKNLAPESVSLVLSNNFIQNKAIIYNQLLEEKEQIFLAQAIAFLEKEQIINREAQAMPPQEEILSIIERDGHLPRPILCNLLASVKLYAQREIHLETDALNDFFLDRYFPKEMQKWQAYFEKHQLSKEIISTLMVNYVVDHAGIGIFQKSLYLLDLNVNETIDLYMKASTALDTGNFRQREMFPNSIDRKLDIKNDGKTIMKLYAIIEDSIFRMMEISRLFQGKSGIEIEDLQLPSLNSLKWENLWIENIDEKTIDEIKKRWLHIEVRYAAKHLIKDLNRLDEFYEYYHKNGFYHLKKALYDLYPDNRWEVYLLLSLKKKLWTGLTTYYLEGKKIKDNFTSELEQLKKRDQANLSAIGGMLGYLFD